MTLRRHAAGLTDKPMLRNRFLASFATLALLFLPSPAAAWWEYGHETTAEVAMRLVKPRTRLSIEWLLARQKVLETPTCPAGTIEQVSVWPDCIKKLGDRFNYAYAWHFQDVDICKPFDLKEPCAGGNCVSSQIARAQRMIADRELPARDRLMALAFLVHFVGDLHQPLHGSEHDGDQGGNKLKASYGFIPRSNLHSIWDGLLADRAISTPPAGADGILSQVSPARRAEIAQGTLEDWSRESWEMAKAKVYGSLIPDPCAGAAPEKVAMTQAKIEELIPVLREQVAKGGIRLARLLDEALDGNHPEVAHPPKPAKKG